MMERVLLLFGLVALATSFTIPAVSPEVHEVYENGEDENPILNKGSDANLFEGDILIPEGRNALIEKRYRWKFPIPYILGDDLDLNAKGCVHQAFEMYRLKSCIDFKPYEGEKTYIKFEKRGGCFSSVGDQQDGQILSLGSGCDHKAVIEHELLHALGFYHEQSRTDRDDYVDIWLDQVSPGLGHNFNKYNDDFITDQNTAYDYESIMHYRPFSFNKNESIPTITTKIPEFFYIIGQYLDFSKMDTLRLNRMYNCSGTLTLLDQCSFEYASICGMIQASNDDAYWVHTKSSVSEEDHTLLGRCRDAGYFMHFSTRTGKPAESALLESRTLYPKRKLQCLQFFYKMTGSSKDRLVIWVKRDDGTGVVRKMEKIHTFNADSDHTWKITHIPMEVGVKFRYAFQAVRGEPSASAGGIYIDDISLTETRCPNAVWTIRNFSKIMETATTNTSIDSPRFYSPEGYGYGVRVFPLSSYTDYTGGYTGLYFYLVSGGNDVVMQWPVVNRQATLVVMDQDPDIKLRMSTARSLTTDMRKRALLKYFGSPQQVPAHTTTSTEDTVAGQSTSTAAVGECETTRSAVGTSDSDVIQETASDNAVPSTSITEETTSDNAGISVPIEVESSTITPTTPTSVTSTPFLSGSPMDPTGWPSVLNDHVRTDLVIRRPVQVDRDFVFPKTPNNRSFHYHYMFRTLVNGEKVKRSWLIYSKNNDSVYCFCCKLFSKKSLKLITEGQQDWVNIGALLKLHDNSPDHVKSVLTWKELELRLRKGKTIDKTELYLLEAEKKRWREVLIRLVSIIQSLAERNLGLRGTVDTLHKHNNGNFLKEVELIAKFDPVLKEHIRRIDSGGNYTTYLGKTIQNELMSCISDTILAAMVAEIKESKYFAIILDCTPDVSHQEQMTVVIRTVSVKKRTEIREHFLGFIIAPESTGLGLSTLILNRLEELKIPFEDCRGQSYDNGANMKGRNKGVQARLLEKNPRALYVPCAAHTLNLMVADSAKGSIDATCFFGNVQKLYTLFSGSPQRWTILKKHVDITLKSWSETRWESRVNSIEPLRYQTDKVREALLEVRENTNDLMVRIEAQSLAEEIGSFRFQICTVVWYDILSKINTVSKLLQSVNMQLDVAVSLLDKTKASLVTYRATGFTDAQATAKELCGNMNVEAVLKEKRLRSKKRHFAYEAADEAVADAMTRLETGFFNVVVDCGIQSLEDRFKSLGEVRDKFGMLHNFHNLDDESLTDQCALLGKTLTCGEEADVDWRELAMEMQSLPELPKEDMTTLEMLTFLNENELCEIYPNLWIALRIACTLPVTVASAERCFSKLKLIKTYLRSSMAQDRLSGMAIISINHQIGSQISYDQVINDFASRKARREQF